MKNRIIAVEPLAGNIKARMTNIGRNRYNNEFFNVIGFFFKFIRVRYLAIQTSKIMDAKVEVCIPIDVPGKVNHLEALAPSMVFPWISVMNKSTAITGIAKSAIPPKYL